MLRESKTRNSAPRKRTTTHIFFAYTHINYYIYHTTHKTRRLVGGNAQFAQNAARFCFQVTNCQQCVVFVCVSVFIVSSGGLHTATGLAECIFPHAAESTSLCPPARTEAQRARQTCCLCRAVLSVQQTNLFSIASAKLV